MHFANADVENHLLNEQQKNQFLAVKQACAPILASCCNSAALYQWPELNFDFVQWGEKARSGVLFIALILSIFCAWGGKLFITDEF